MAQRPAAQLTSAERTARDEQIYLARHQRRMKWPEICEEFGVIERTAIRAERRHRYRVEELDIGSTNPLRVLQEILDVHHWALDHLAELGPKIPEENVNGHIGLVNARVRAAQGLLEIMQATGLVPVHTGAWGLIRDVPDLVRAIQQVAENNGLDRQQIRRELELVPGVKAALDAAGREGSDGGDDGARA